MQEIHLIKFIVTLSFLLYACKLDLESRIVPNRIWKYMLLVILPLVVFELYLSNLTFQHVVFALFQFGMMFSLSYLLYRVGAYGGADAKAIMVLSALFPFYPYYNGFPLLNTGFGVFAFSTLANSVIAAPLLPLLVFFRNLAREGLNIRGNLLYYFVGYRVPVDKIPEFHNLFEYFDESGRLIRVKRAVEPDKATIARLKKFAELKKMKKVWVTPALPFLLFITAGYVIAFFVGDLLFHLISLLRIP
jgi:preflagellin peptidase FlaK